MSKIFIKKDPLLSAAYISIYYLLVKAALKSGKINKIKRKSLLDFRKKLVDNKKIAEEDISKSDFPLLEFDRMSQQGTNDASSIRGRYLTLGKYMDLKTEDLVIAEDILA